MIGVTDLKAGKTFLFEGKPFKVLKYFHQKIGRGGANVRLTVRNLESGTSEEKTFNSSHKVEEISTQKRELQYLYSDANSACFMDPRSYEQVEIPLSVVGDETAYIKEGEEVNVLFWGDKPLSIDIPPKVTLSIKETTPGVKGNSATNIYKPATLENGAQIKVPLFINTNDKVVVDTRTGEYVERAK